MRRLCGFGFLLLLFFVFVCLGRFRRETFSPPPVQNESFLVGAYYYVWYPKNFKQGMLRKDLRPQQVPEAGWYDSADPKIAERHIALCSRYGIDFLALDYWPSRPEQNQNIQDGFLKANNLDDIRFCLFFETWNLGFDRAEGTLRFTKEISEKFLKQMDQIAEEFFAHPRYLKIQGRPVLILYLTRVCSGEYQKPLSILRERLRKKGYDIFLIGDEVFWETLAESWPWQKNPPLSANPNKKRMACFDAITAYNMYEGNDSHQEGYGSRSRYFEKVAGRFQEYRDVFRSLKRPLRFIPNVIPGYNDRGVRPRQKHYAIPREWSTGGGEGGFFEKAFEKIVFPFLDPALNMILVTSWNEWNEDTAIEPLEKAPPTSQDKSGENYFTEGYAYSGYGTRYLEVLRDETVAVYGRVTDHRGQPMPQVEVSAWKNDKKYASDRTDHEGCYTLSRLRLSPGSYEIRVGNDAKKMLVIPPEKKALEVNSDIEKFAVDRVGKGSV